MTREPSPTNPNRRLMLQAIQENPGLCLRELVDKVGLTRTALSHHLRALTNARAVITVRQGRRLLLFPHSINHPAERSVLGLMRLTTARAVLMGLYANPTVSFRKLAKQLGMTPHSVRWHVARLTNQGLIHVLPTALGHTVHFHPGVRASFDSMPPPPVELLEAAERPQRLEAPAPPGLVLPGLP